MARRVFSFPPNNHTRSQRRWFEFWWTAGWRAAWEKSRAGGRWTPSARQQCRGASQTCTTTSWDTGHPTSAAWNLPLADGYGSTLANLGCGDAAGAGAQSCVDHRPATTAASRNNMATVTFTTDA